MSDSHYETHATHETSIPRLLGGSDPEDDEPIREGLPPGFRMRADSHYVESLDRPAADLRVEDLRLDEIDASDRAQATSDDPLVRSIERHGLLEPLLVVRDGSKYVLFSGERRLAAARAAGLSRVPCVVREIDERVRLELLRTRAGLDEVPSVDARPDATAGALGHDMDTALRHLERALELTSAGGLTQQVALDLSRAHATHALCLRRVIRALQGPAAAPRRDADLRAIVEQAQRNTEAERRLRGATLDARLDGAATKVLVDPELLASGLSLVLGAAFEAPEPHAPRHVLLQCETGPDGVTLRVATGHDRAPAADQPAHPAVGGSARVEAARLAMDAAGCSVTIRCDDDGLDAVATVPLGVQG
jgi:ParB-like chromosome segregation protein Spo0J